MAKSKKNDSQKVGDFPERLKTLRLQKNLSQIELADLINVHHTHISRYERGETTPAVKALIALAKALNVSTDYLLEGVHKDAAIANLDDKELLKMFEETEKLPQDEKELVKKFLGAFLNNKKIKELAG
jgi:transcriptional regulator with XRE-family HTH domain